MACERGTPRPLQIPHSRPTEVVPETRSEPRGRAGGGPGLAKVAPTFPGPPLAGEVQKVRHDAAELALESVHLLEWALISARTSSNCVRRLSSKAIPSASATTHVHDCRV